MQSDLYYPQYLGVLNYGLKNRGKLRSDWISYFSAHCISDHRVSKPNPNSNLNLNHNPNPNPNPDNSPDHDCFHLLVRDAVGRKGGHRPTVLFYLQYKC